MDAVLTAAMQSAPQLGIGGILFALLMWFVRHAATDRGDYRSTLDAAEIRHASELKRIAEAHDAELRELREDIAALRTQLDELNLALDVEREDRRKAEDRAAEALRRAGGHAP